MWTVGGECCKGTIGRLGGGFMVALSPCATTSTWFGWWALALSAIALQRVCQKRSGCDRQKIQKTPQDTVETVKKPNNNKVKMKNLGVKKGHLSQGHSPLLLVVLLLSCFGCCNADAFPQSPKTPFSGTATWLQIDTTFAQRAPYRPFLP